MTRLYYRDIGVASILALALIPTVTNAWLIAPSNFNECVRKYAGQLTDEKISELVMSSCNLYFDATSKADKKTYECAVENVSASKNYSAAQIAFIECSEKFQPPAPSKKASKEVPKEDLPWNLYRK